MAVVPALERLDERRARAGERVEHAAAARDVAAQQLLDELRDELPEVRMQAVDVLRPLALRQLALGPRELDVELGVEGVLRHRHCPLFGAPAPLPSSQNAARTHSSRRPRTATTSNRTANPAYAGR